jgi:hypothetical protein
MILIIGALGVTLMTWVCTAHKGFLTILVRKVTVHHPHDLRLRLGPLLLVEIMIGLDHWRMTMMTWVGTAPQRAF